MAVQPVGTRSRPTMLWLAVLVAVAFLAHLGMGSTAWYSPLQVFRELLHGPTDDGSSANVVVWVIRLPRAVVCVLVGTLLGLVGSAFQALFRNPLADPYIVGVSSGAAIGGALCIVLGVSGAWVGLATMGAGTVTGLLALGLVWWLAQRGGRVDVSSLLLAGVVVGSMLSAILSMILLAGGRDSGVVLRWLLGSTTPAFWPTNGLLLVVLVVGGSLLFGSSRSLNAFALGESVALTLGVDTAKLIRRVLVIGTLMTAAAVGAVGILGFLGLVAPHVARRLVGVDWRDSLPASGLVGALLLLVADAVAQRGIQGVELPVGIVTALLGAPSLLILMRRAA
ncbi:MAG: FecCD family ABC transporter permease [Fimbriimonas sp.]